MDCSLPGSSIYGILQVKLLEWLAIPFSSEYSHPEINHRFLNCRQILHYLSHQGLYHMASERVY